MSLATKARLLVFREGLTRSERRRGLEPFSAWVTFGGKLHLPDGQQMSAKQALRFARWIQRSFQ